MPNPKFLDTIAKQSGAKQTTLEIRQQPDLWKEVSQLVDQQKHRLSHFLHTASENSDYIIFTGAGSSAFIGLSLFGHYFKNTGLISQAVATTDIVSHPHDYFNKKYRPFILSFARSGNSPESVAALQLADRYARGCYHLIITCDGNGDLARYESTGKTLVLTLPEQANDKGLAMTSSYSSMLLTALLALYLDQLPEQQKQINLLADSSRLFLEQSASKLQQIAHGNFSRAVFLGSGALFGTATEAHLKLQELTNGQIICKADTYLGFRHGPKAVLNEDTLVVFFVSADEGVQRYEYDLIQTILKESKALSGENGALHCLLIAPDKKMIDLLMGQSWIPKDQFTCIAPEMAVPAYYWPLSAITIGQLLALFTSIHLGLTPDNPSKNGAISRVVRGVTIYPELTKETVPSTNSNVNKYQ